VPPHPRGLSAFVSMSDPRLPFLAPLDHALLIPAPRGLQAYFGACVCFVGCMYALCSGVWAWRTPAHGRQGGGWRALALRARARVGVRRERKKERSR